MTRPDYRARIAEYNPSLNAFVDLTEEPQGYGLCWGAKSNIAVAGLPLTAGCAAYCARIADSDAPVIDRIRAAGGTVLGTVNMHEGALGATPDGGLMGAWSTLNQPAATNYLARFDAAGTTTSPCSSTHFDIPVASGEPPLREVAQAKPSSKRRRKPKQGPRGEGQPPKQPGGQKRRRPRRRAA